MSKILIEDFYDHKRVANLKLSPDKQHACFNVQTIVNDGYRNHIWILDIKTKEYAQLSVGGKERAMFWADNDKIVFPALRDADLKKKTSEGEIWTEYYTIDINTKEEKEFLQIPAKVNSITAIDDDNYILTCKYNKNDISLYGLEGEEREQAIQEKKDENDYILLEEIPYCSNGSGFVSRVRNRIYTFKKSTGALVPVTDEITDVANYKYHDSKIIYTAKVFENVKPDKGSLHSYNMETGKNTVLIPDGEYNIGSLNFVGDDLILTMSDEKDYGQQQYKDFYIYKDGKFTLLCEYDTGFGRNPDSDFKGFVGGENAICQDGLYFLSTIHCGSYLNKLSLDGKITVLTAKNGQVTAFGICDDEIIFIGPRGNRLAEVYSLKDGVETQITTLNDFVQEKSISTPVPTSFINSDGIEIEGFFIKPIDFDPNKKYPALLTIHGGPRSALSNTFAHQMQIWANEGYFVFFANPRGSCGRDSDFQELRGKFGTIDFQDLMEFTDHVLAINPQIDENRLGVIGGSYGGFMTYWIVGHTDRFKCAVSQHAVASWITQFGTSDVGYNSSASKAGGTPWTDVEKMWWHSPLKYADKISCPILLLYSENDYRVCLSEGAQMFTALKFLGKVPVEMRIFKGENHGLSGSGKPKLRNLRLHEIQNWFDKYLK